MHFGSIVGKSTTLLQPFPSGKAFVQECLEVKLFPKSLDDLSKCEVAQIDFCPGCFASLSLQKIREE